MFSRVTAFEPRRNVICVGRMQERKRLARLVDAVALMNRADIGVILVGPDTESILGQFEGDTVYKLGAVYGNDKFDLLSAADVYCLPGAVGLSIVDAFYCGLPFVTEDGDESAEITYLQNGVNGFSVQKRQRSGALRSSTATSRQRRSPPRLLRGRPPRDRRARQYRSALCRVSECPGIRNARRSEGAK